MIDRRPFGLAVASGAVISADVLALSWSDPASQWGLGVFETVAVRAFAPQWLDAHLARLAAGASRLDVPLPPLPALADAARTVAGETGGTLSWLKIAVSRSGAWAVFGGPADAEAMGRSVSAVVLPWRRHRLDPITGIKTMAYAPAILGLEEAGRRGADEGLWLNDRGHLIGAASANVFVARGRMVVTPALSDGARDGVTRARAISALRQHGLTVRETKVRMTTLRGADEVFLTSSLKGVRPVVRIDQRPVRRGEAGAISRRLQAALDAETDHA